MADSVRVVLSGKTIAQAAKHLSIPEHRIRNRIARGTLQAVKIGWMWLIPDTEIARLEAKKK